MGKRRNRNKVKDLNNKSGNVKGPVPTPATQAVLAANLNGSRAREAFNKQGAGTKAKGTEVPASHEYNMSDTAPESPAPWKRAAKIAFGLLIVIGGGALAYKYTKKDQDVADDVAEEESSNDTDGD